VTAPHGSIDGLVRHIEPGLAVASQLGPQHMAAVRAAGFASVINNRPDGEAGLLQPTDAQIRAAAQAAGLHYVFLPVPPSGHADDDARRMAAWVQTLPPPVLAFCRSGARSMALYLKGRALE
jgi:uncharacterized protein (TIGR01244 family)